MSLRKQVLNEVDGLISEFIDGAAGALERREIRRQAEPDRWYAFHSEMTRRLPTWRRIAIAWHTMQARRFKALAGANNLTANLSKYFPGV